MEQSNSKVECLAHELAYGKFLNRLIVDYKDVKLSDSQLYSLYQQCCNIADFVEIINTGSAESLP